MFGIGKLGRVGGVRTTLASLLAKYGSNAHAWLPGASGVSVASLPSNNYLLSDGSTGYSTVDGVDGLTLDGMGSLGAELVIPAYGVYNSTLTNGGVFPFTATSTVASNYGASIAALTVGVWYQVTVSWTGNASGRRIFCDAAGGTNVGNSASGTNTVYFQATSTVHYIAAASAAGAGETITFTACTVKPYTGTHLTQATTANKPLVRRGMLNELLNSATPATQSVTCIAAPYTLALYGTGNVVLSGTGAGTLTGTGASDLVVLNFTPTAGSVTFTKAGTVSSFGLFKGTWTAAQILAEGGIPTTTATAASNPTSGKYWWSFDGSNDSLLSGNLGITNTVTVVVAGVVNSLGTTQAILGEASGGFLFYITTTGAVILDKVGAATVVTTSAGAISALVPFVLTVRLSGGTAVIRLNGVQIATAASALSFAATTGARIGTALDGTSYPFNGSLYSVNVIAATTTDADCLAIERLVAQQAGIAI